MTHAPKRCPHGEPIPSAEGVMPRVRDYPLNGQDAGVTYAISRVNTHDMDKLKYLGDLGLRPGKQFKLVSRAPFNGPLTLELNGETILMGHELAGVLRVCAPEAFDLN
jgi:DtxR family Mn-dependent transcriptional regulator